MSADRAAAGLGAAAIAVAVAFAPGGFSIREVLALAVAGALLAVTFAPILPWLNRLPKVGAPQVSVYLNFGTDEGLVLRSTKGQIAPTVLRVGFKNDGPRRAHRSLVNVILPEAIQMEGTDHSGRSEYRHGRPGPPTPLDGEPGHFWIDADVDFPVGHTQLHYALSFPDTVLRDSFPIRVQYDSDDLYGPERVVDAQVLIVDCHRDRG
jgi:hypothetical protein